MRMIDRAEILLVASFVGVVGVGLTMHSPVVTYAKLKAEGRVDSRCTLALTRLSSARERSRNELIASGQAITATLEAGAYKWDTPVGVVWTPLSDGAGPLRRGGFTWGPPIVRWTPIEGSDEPTIRPGDVMIDAGAHSGGSTKHALAMGASLVVAIEPVAENLVALRRNLAEEISAGKVIVIEKGVYDRIGNLTFVKRGHSWDGEFHDADDGHDGHGDALPVTTIDAIVSELGLTKLDFIKMDIEGSEPYALRGARETIRRLRPRIAVGTYHRPGDLEAIHRIVTETDQSYEELPSRCLVSEGKLFPHLLYFR